ncbi:MAG TPA: MFS transporter, partial [Caulobacteraceae bacterium]|nr:MFS transporter [Caulobacteraceae bacterium]
RSRWGRRHPFMYVAAPLAPLVCVTFWNSPTAWPTPVLGVYLIGILVLMRLAISLFEVPCNALAPELAPDYHQRTGLLSYRFFFGVIAGVAMNAVLYKVFLSGPQGVLSRDGYAHYGVVAAAVMLVSILISAGGTHREIARLSRPAARRITLRSTIREIAGTLGNPSLVVVMASGLISGVGTGMTAALQQYFQVELWHISASQIFWLNMGALAGTVLAAGLASPISRRFGKKRSMIILFSAYLVAHVTPLSLKLLNLMPPDGSPWIFVILLADTFVAITLVITGLIIISSMLADVVEDAAVKTGVRSEGLLFAANGLLPKFTAGMGVFAAGVVLTLVGFPTHAGQGLVDATVMRHLAMIYLPISFVLTGGSIAVLVFYRIDEATHAHNLASLKQASAAAEIGREIEPEPPSALS